MDNGEKFLNDVPAEKQVAAGGNIRIFGNEGVKILFMGNSITLHEPAHELGWHGDWGMAASKKENDYVHKVLSGLQEKNKKISYCICHCSDWERGFMNKNVLCKYESAREFNANIVVIRLGDNIQPKEAENYDLEKSLKCFIEYVSAGAKKIIITDLFWKCAAIDNVIKQVAKEKSCDFVLISDLGFIKEMKAEGQFKSAGVGLHPSDKGMEVIAERILAAIIDGGI